MTPQFRKAVGAMANIPQWFAWTLKWDAAAGKFQKTPGVGHPVDVSIAANWTDYDKALATVARLDVPGSLTRYALGFRLTKGCGYFLFDLDKCVTDGNATDFAKAMIAGFSGSMLEYSSSERGVHIIGKCSDIEHRSMCKEFNMEFYTENRGICFGLGGAAWGSADSMHNTAVAQLVDRYFKPQPAGLPTIGAVPEYTGPFDDGELMAKFLDARPSAAATFGTKIGLPQLWRGECEKDSHHDMALASHLAFWTGRDAERVERLMLRSGLYREKWNEFRPQGGTYLRMTIQNACAQVSSVYISRVLAPPSPAPIPDTNVRTGDALMQRIFPPVQWALRDLIPQGTAILIAAPKSGKSWLVLQGCMAVSAGVPLWSGRDADIQGDTLYLDLEGNDRRLQERISGLLRSFPANVSLEKFHYETEWPRAEAGVAKLREWLLAHPGCRMIVIDTLATFRDPDPGRKSAYATDYAVGEMLKPLTREFPVAIVLVTHTRKQAAGNAMDMISGTQGLVGGVDNYMILTRGGGDMDAELVADGRDIKDRQELALRSRKDGGWTCVGKSVDIKRSSERNDVLKVLTSIGGAGTPREIRAALEDCVAPGTLHTRLSRMVKAGEILKTGTLYTLVSMDNNSPQLPERPGGVAKL